MSPASLLTPVDRDRLLPAVPKPPWFQQLQFWEALVDLPWVLS